MPSNRTPYHRTWLYVALVAVLAFTGFGQMPLYKRYYISDIPGLAWSSNFFLTLKIHYVAGALFLAYLGYALAVYWVRRRIAGAPAPGGLATVRALVLAGLAGTGILRVIKNLPDMYLGPNQVLAIDWLHMLLAVALLGVAVAAWRKKRGTT